MIKLIHLTFILTSVVSFSARFALSFFKPEILQNKFIKIAPHVIDTVLLMSGVALVLQGSWLEGEFGWIVSKLTLLVGYIIFGVIAMRTKTTGKRWIGFLAAMLCYVGIFIIAITKNGFF
ncbi:MAG: SirB2 family protein [Methylococcaceae bacterium]|nr:SirB2 family protein [Methylococcaceae bacterium]